MTMSLYASFRKKLLSFDLSVDIEVSDETVSIFGFSGAGKSMTLKCISGIETPDSGLIMLNGRVLYDSERGINLPPQKRRVGYLFQDYALFPHMTVEQNIMAGMKIKDRAAVMEWLRRYELSDCIDRYPAELSGGQKQRTAIIRMLASEPDCLLLDEPFSALDVQLKWRLEQEMKELLKNISKPVILVSHDRDEVFRLSDRVGCMRMGNLEGIRKTDDVFDHPLTETEAVLAGCENIASAYRCEDGSLYIAEWNHRIAASGENICAAGIRSDKLSVHPISDSCIEIQDSEIQRGLDGHSLVCRAKGGSGRLKCSIDAEEVCKYDRLYYRAEDMLLLKDDNHDK